GRRFSEERGDDCAQQAQQALGVMVLGCSCVSHAKTWTVSQATCSASRPAVRCRAAQLVYPESLTRCWYASNPKSSGPQPKVACWLDGNLYKRLVAPDVDWSHVHDRRRVSSGSAPERDRSRD